MSSSAPQDGSHVRIGLLSSTYARLPAQFHAHVTPSPVAVPQLICVNYPLAADLGLELAELDTATLAALFAGNLVPDGAEPIASAYAGHQFGNFVPQLGDGRAILVAETVDAAGARWDLQLKGSGPTPFSRAGDGRAALGPVLREYLVSEAMHALGIPSTRALAAVSTGEQVMREGPLPGAVLTRVAASHIRVGTFEFHAARGDDAAVKQLADYVLARHYPALQNTAQPIVALLEAIVARQAKLIARWMQVGFIHGVMNTDNMTVSGETIDFGPCAFMDAYHPATVYSAIDRGGRYAYANQPRIGMWNLARLAETLIPHIDPVAEKAVEIATASLLAFQSQYTANWLAGMRAKLGLRGEQPDDPTLIESLLEAMHSNAADWTNTFRALCAAAEGDDTAARGQFADPSAFDHWAVAWRARLALEAAPGAVVGAGMRAVNPAIIPRNHQVERALRAAIDGNDFEPFDRLRSALATPYCTSAETTPYEAPPSVEERVLQTFCGT
ncbi:MAG: YdiU family protein [Pseudomonadota bacterium]